MSVRFKFRSCAAEDSVDLRHGRCSISVRELREEIMRKKNLKLCEDFDLVLSDALTGKVLEEDDLELPAGSRVIVKRVPAWTSGSARSSKLPLTVKLQHADPEQIRNKISNVQHMPLLESEPIVEKNTKFERVFPSEHPASEAAHFPPELKCFLCGKLFTEAVMITCCQQSFCGGCIRAALTEKGKCPICFSTKTRVDDLLPNLSLRQAIDSFLNNRTMVTGSESGRHMDIPDEESRIEGTGVVQTRRVKCKPEIVEDVVEIQDENPTSTVQEWQKQGQKTYPQHPGRQKRGDRTCYMCGSPDHLIRDCPSAAPYHLYGNGSVPGYPPPNWYVAGMPTAPSYANMYPGYGMMSYNATMAPTTNFGPPYPPFMYGSFPVSRAWVTEQGGNLNQAGEGIGRSGKTINDRKRIHDGDGTWSNNYWTETNNKKYKHESCSLSRPQDIEPSCAGFQNPKPTSRSQRNERA